MNPKPKKSKAFYIKRGIIILLFSAAAIALLAPLFMQQTGHGHSRGESISNAKQIGLALFDFENDYGSYPDKETAKDVTDAFPNHGYDLTGNSSNALFRQLLASGIVSSEEIFYAETKNSKKPDGIITPGEALNKGEVGFAYISGFSAEGNSKRILVIGPAIPGTTKFDPKPFDGKAIALHIDQSATTYTIGKDGHIHDKDGDILSPKHPIWNGKKPTIHYPE